jgi:hypothetical protein
MWHSRESLRSTGLTGSWRWLVLSAALILASRLGQAAEAEFQGPELQAFLKANCFDCHSGKSAEAGFDLEKLGTDLNQSQTEKHWVRIHDRVHSGEMPPADATQPKPAARESFLKMTGEQLAAFQNDRAARIGRVHTRRLTRVEIERSLHALLGIDIPLADQLPEESRAAGFTTVAEAQALSHFQLERQLAVSPCPRGRR